MTLQLAENALLETENYRELSSCLPRRAVGANSERARAAGPRRRVEGPRYRNGLTGCCDALSRCCRGLRSRPRCSEQCVTSI